MANQSNRPPIRIRLQFNIETGEIELIVDDMAPDRSEAYHDQVAEAIAAFLVRHPEIEDAGPIRYRLNQEWDARPAAAAGTDETPDEPETLHD